MSGPPDGDYRSGGRTGAVASGTITRGGFDTYALAPRYEISISDVLLGPEIAPYITKLEYESSDGIADMAKVTISNPEGVLTDKKFWQAGNYMNVWIGYQKLEFVGRVLLTRPRFIFPEDDMPSIQLCGYSADVRMMDGRKVPGQRQRDAQARREYRARTGRKAVEQLRGAWPAGTRVDRIARDICENYGFDVDVDFAEVEKNTTQSVKKSDYDVLKGLANTFGFAFWVDADSSGKWTLHMKRPDSLSGRIPNTQEKSYRFQYSVGGISTLLHFEPEYTFRDAKVKLRVEATNPNGNRYTADFEDDADPTDTAGTSLNEEIGMPVASGGSAKLFLGDYQLEIVTNRRFAGPDQLQRWAKQWFDKNRARFICGAGRTVGVETLAARQTHFLEGLGRGLSGEYYFSRVRHKLSGQDGYVTEFDARRIIETPGTVLRAQELGGVIV